MDVKHLMRVGMAANKIGVNRTTLFEAVTRGDIRSFNSACGLPMVLLSDCQKWAEKPYSRGRRGFRDDRPNDS